jgi:hypothetical protein
MVPGTRFRVRGRLTAGSSGSRFKVLGSEFRVQGLGFRV